MILVTGGTGLLGSHLLPELVKRNEDVVATKRKSSDLGEVKRLFGYYSGEEDALFARIRWVDTDLLDYVALLDVMEGVKRVYHCAGMVSFERQFRRKMMLNNVRGTANVVDACLEKHIEKMVHVSSSSAIGQPPDGELADESMIFAPSRSGTGYALSKFKSEMEVWRGIEHGLKAVIVNPTIIVGPGHWDRGSSSMFPAIKRGVPFYTTGATGFVGVQDVVEAMIRLMDSEISGERFILNSENLSYRELFGLISAAFGQERSRRAVSYRLLMLLSRLDCFAGFLTRKRHITPEQVRAAFSVNRFSNKKIREAIGMEFASIEEVIGSVVKRYRAEVGGMNTGHRLTD